MTSLICDEVMEKREKQLNLWIHEIMTHKKSIMDGTVVQRADSLDKTLMLGKIEGRRRRG